MVTSSNQNTVYQQISNQDERILRESDTITGVKPLSSDIFAVFAHDFIVLLQGQRYIKIDIGDAFSATLNGELVEIFSPKEYSIFKVNFDQEYYKILSTTSILNSALVEDVLGKFKLQFQMGSTLVFDGFGLQLDTYHGKMKKILKCPKVEQIHPEP